EANVHLLRYDTVHGRFPGEVRANGESITLRHQGKVWGPIKVTAEKDPAATAIRGIDVALECTGRFTKREQALRLIEAGARKVLVSAPAEGADATIVYGVNQSALTPDDKIISAASCTTNCLVPVVKVLHDSFRVLRGYMVTVHSYTGDQRTIDTLHKDFRRARAAAANIIPTSTGAAKSVGLVLPELKGKLDGTAMRVPTPNVSLVSLDIAVEGRATKDSMNGAMKAASEGALTGVLDYSTEPLVSSDFIHNPASSIFDASQTAVVDGELYRVMAWYDNEW